MKNILLILTDQQRADTIHALGNEAIQTPALDALANDSTVFSRCYTPSPVCVPARMSLMLGLYPNHTGCNDNSDCEYNRQTLYSRFSNNGYQTCGIGKMHFPNHPYALHGFQSRFTQEELYHSDDDYGNFLKANGYGDVFDYHGQRSEMYYIPQVSQLPQRAHPTQWVGDRSVEFIRNRDPKRPFFLMSSFIHPHPPFAPPAPWNKLYRNRAGQPFVPEGSDALLTYYNAVQNNYKGLGVGIDRHLVDRMRCHYYACISFVDYQIGLIIAELKRQGLYDDTTIVFTSDHGELLGDYNALGKRTMLDGAALVPMLVKSDAPHRIVRRPVSLVDVAPTLLAQAGIHDPDAFDGIDLLRDEHAYVYSQIGNGTTGLYMVASECDKLIFSRPDGRYYYFDAFPESENRYSPDSERCAELRQLLDRYIAEDRSPQRTVDVGEVLRQIKETPYKPIRQDHDNRREAERACIPEGYSIDL